LRESVLASGVPEEAVDTYIANLQAEGLSDTQIQEIADNTRVLREEAAKKNEADAEARREVARKARAGDPEARAQLERERGINPATTTTPAAEPATAPTIDQVPPLQTTNEGGDPNELRMRNQEEGQGRTEALVQETPEEAGTEDATPSTTQAEAPAPSVAKIQAKRSEDPEGFDNSDPETQLSELPANDALDLLRKVGSTLDTPPIEGDETFGAYLERTGVSVYDFDTRPTVFNESEKRYVLQGQDPFEGLKDLAAGRVQLQDVQLPPAANEVAQTTPEEQERNRKAQETEDFYRRNQQQTSEREDSEGATAADPVKRHLETAKLTVEAEVSMSGDKGAVSGKRLPVREIPTGRSDESGRPITKVVPGFVNDSNTMAEVLYQNRGVERVYVPASEIENLDPEDIFVQYDETGQAYVVAARHKKYGVIYADTGLTQDGVSLAQLHEPTRLKNSQAQTEGKASKLKAKKAGVSEGEITIPEMTEAFEQRIARAGISKEEKEKPESVAKTLQQIYKKAQALASETVKTVTGETVSIGAELADRIGAAATNLYLARLRGVDRKGKFKDASGVVADIKKKVVAKLQKRPGTRAGVSLDQPVGEDGGTVGDFIGQRDQPLDSMGYPDVPLDSDMRSQEERGLENLAGATPEMKQDPNVQAAQSDRQGLPQEVAQRLGGLNYEEIAKNALAAAEAELTPAELKIWRETLPIISGGKKRQDLTDSRKKIVKKVQASAKEKMQAMISEANYEADIDSADSMLSAAESSTQSLDERQSRQERTTRAKYHSGQIIDWNGGPTAKGFDTKRVLGSIAEDTKLPQLVRVVARFLANSNVDFSNVKFELIANYQKDLNWAGLYTAGDRASAGKIQINISSLHRGGNIAQTIVHEALHHVAFHKLRPSYNRTGVEREAYRDLVRILTHVRKQLLVPEPGKSLSRTARESFSKDDDFYGVSNLDELFTETLTNERFAAWLSSQAPIPGMQPKNSGVFRNLYDQIKQFLKNLIGGQNVRPDSLLSQAMDNIFALANDPQDDAKIAKYLGQGLNQSMSVKSQKPSAPNYEQEAKKIKNGRNYWVTPTGKVIDIFAEAIGRDDEGASAASHGLYIKQWVKDRLGKFTPDKIEQGMAVVIQSKVNRLVSEDPSLKSEVSEDEMEGAYQEELSLAESIGYDAPDRDDFFAQARKAAGPLPIAYVQAAQESGWARVTSDASVAKIRGAKTGAAFGGEIHIEVMGESLSLDAKAVVDKISKLKKGVRVVTQGAIQKKQAERPTQILAFREMFGREEGYLANAVDAGMQKVQEQADRARRLVKPESTQGYQLVEAPNSFGVPAMAYLDENGQGVIEYDPNWVAVEISGLDDADAQAVVDKLLGHEQAHIAGLLNDYKTSDAEGRVGRSKIEAFHDEVMTEEMRQQTADAYVRRLNGMTDEDYAKAKFDFLSDKVAVAGEYKRMFLERYLTGESYEDSLATLARKTGNKFTDLVRAIADYLAGRIRMMQTRFEMTKDSRLAAEIIADRRMLENLNNGTNGMLGDSVAGVLSAAAVSNQTARWNELTSDLQGRELTQADLDAWAKSNPEKYAELEKMRESILKRDGYSVGPVYHGTETKNKFTVFKDKNEEAYSFDESLKFFTDEEEIADFSYGGDFGHTKKVFLKMASPQSLTWPVLRWKGLDKKYDGIVIPPSQKFPADEIDRIMAVGGNRGAEEFGTTYAVRESSQIKSADPLNLENGRLIPPDEWAQSKNPDIRFASRAQRTRMMNTSGGWKAAGGLTQNLMDSEVSELIDQKDAAIRGANFKVSETARKFDRLVKKHKPNAQVLNTALGSTENTLTDTQYDAWQKLQRAAKRETDPVKRQAAMAASDSYRLTQVQANNKQIRADRQAALNKLPKELANTVDVMRGHIDGLSKTLKNKGLVGNNLQITLGANLEVYLNRSYEVFDNPEWADFILTDQSPESQLIRNNAARILKAQLVAEEARRIRRDARMNNTPVPTRAQAIAAAHATVTNNDVGILMRDYLRVGDNNGLTISGGNNPAKKNTSILKLRGQIPKEIRELWGEYKDPQVNYAKTYMKMASFVATHNFQQDFLNMGLSRATPFLWKDGSSQGVRPMSWVEIVPGLKDKPNPNPLAGVYGPPIIAEAFEDIRKTYKHSLVNDWMTGLTGLAMASKTIYNPPQTYVRNVLGNGLIMVSQGYVLTDLGRLGFLTRLANSAYVTGPSLVGARPERSTAVTDYVERMIKLGVMGDNVKANVIKNLTSVVFDRDPGKAFNGALSKALTTAKGVNDRLTDAYQAGDDLWKIVAFESERSVFARAFPNATPESIDRMAADRVRDVVPTYSKIPQAVQEVVKRQPYLAPYISWTSEIIRTFANTYKHGWNDATSNNPVLRASGLKRLASVTVAQGLLGALAYGVRELSGMDDEDEERLRRFLPDWQVNALLMLTGKKEDGKFSFWDLSYLNPYDVLHEPFIAMGREIKAGGDFLGVASKGLSKFIDPWTSEQIFFGALMDAARGVTAEGRPLFEQSDSEFNKNRARISRIVDSITPGAFNFGKRMYKAATGQMTPSGRAYNLNDEFLGAISGQRPSEVDPLQSFKQRNVTAMNRMLQSADSLATKEYRKGGTPDLTKIRENYVQANDARLASLREIRKDVDALVGLGIPNEKVMQTLAASGVSKQDMEQIAAGKYVRRAPSNDALLNAVGLPEYKARIEAMRGAVESYPEVQSLYPSDQP
jgi:hypothetical protein